ncbi:uncharacterized protein N7458_003801 [Penicillium daleae]|uniref:NACHT domain-containing protein n=1 Tax=Penicillium daleae TaxID=63821 RepID=A0AAD6CBA2_9EURO|nr:uncharacterized protein N7458_003801 [Penicillium daleae]KAJ5455537.1 hypothetical protein N7458_003801 [Penicillium daleae]
MLIRDNGLSKVFPRGAVEGNSGTNPLVNIVFVHGLRGHPRRTWEYKQTTVNEVGNKKTDASKVPWLHRALISPPQPQPIDAELDKSPKLESSHNDGLASSHIFWPADELPEVVPQANIFTYGYNANVIEGVFCSNNRNSILHHGNDLMVKLERSLENDSSNDRLLSELQIDSQILDLVQDDFLRVLQNFDISIHSFQESRGLSGIKGFSGKVVDDISSKLGYTLETTETIDANHMEMVLIGSGDISAVLKGYVRDIEKRKDHMPPALIPAVPYDYVHKFRVFNYQDVLSRVPERHPDTCTWLTNNPSFVQWKDSVHHKFFWLHGYPGQGKSVLARYTLDMLREASCSPLDKQDKARPLVCYFFCSDDDQRTKCTTNLLASLIHQLLYEDPGLGRKLKEKYPKIEPGYLESMWQLWDSFSLVLSAVGTRPLYIVIDALDHLNRTEWGLFLRGIQREIQSERQSVKMFLTSRTEPELERTLLSWNILHVSLDDSLEKEGDCALFLREVVHEYALAHSFESRITETVLKEIMFRAKGSFLWASLAWANFQDGIGSWTKDLLYQKLDKLQQLPRKMESLYYRLLCAVDERQHEELLHVLQWIVAARRPLRIDELSVAIALAERPCSYEAIDVRFSLSEFLRRACPHLIRVDDHEYITLVHHSFKAFLLDVRHISLDKEKRHNKFHIDLDQVNIQLARDSYEYLSGKYPFLAYGSRFWVSHIGESDDLQFYQFFKRVLIRPQNYLALCCFTIYLSSFEGPPLFLAMRHGLYGLMKNLVDDGHDINALKDGKPLLHYYKTFEQTMLLLHLGADPNSRDSYKQTILLRRLRNSCQLLVEADSDAGSQAGSDLEDAESCNHLASPRNSCQPLVEADSDAGSQASSDSEDAESCNHLASLQEALSFTGLDFNASDQWGLTSLHAVVALDCLHAEKLLEKLMTRQDLKLNPQDELGRTPLTLAIHWGKENMTRVLLNIPEVNIEIAQIRGENPLINAARQGWTEIVISLLHRLDRIGRFSDSNGRNILHWAIIVGMIDAFELALKKSPDLSAVPDRQGMTPLHYASQENEYRATEMLLSYGTSPTDKASCGRTPLHLAAANGHTRIVKALVAHLPVPSAVNERDSMGWTALHHAVVSGNDVLVSYIVSLPSVDVTKVDRHGRPAVAFAASFAPLSILSILLGARARDLNSRPGEADISCVDAFGNSLLHLAARASNESTLDFLLRRIPHVGNQPNKWGRASISPD